MANENFGQYLKDKRLTQTGKGKPFSVRGLAAKMQVQPSYISKVERGYESLPSAERLEQWAAILEENPDIMFAKANKIRADLRQAIITRPLLMAKLIRLASQLKDRDVEELINLAHGKIPDQPKESDAAE